MIIMYTLIGIIVVSLVLCIISKWQNDVSISVFFATLLLLVTCWVIKAGNSFKIKQFAAEVSSFSVDYEKIKQVYPQDRERPYQFWDYQNTALEYNKRVCKEKAYLTSPWFIKEFLNLNVIESIKTIEL
jgi:hypothetical protein